MHAVPPLHDRRTGHSVSHSLFRLLRGVVVPVIRPTSKKASECGLEIETVRVEPGEGALAVLVHLEPDYWGLVVTVRYRTTVPRRDGIVTAIPSAFSVQNRRSRA